MTTRDEIQLRELFLQQAKSARPVEYTISQDRGAGNTSQAESNYRLLAGKEFHQKEEGIFWRFGSYPSLMSAKSVIAKEHRLRISALMEDQDNENQDNPWEETNKTERPHAEDGRHSESDQDRHVEKPQDNRATRNKRAMDMTDGSNDIGTSNPRTKRHKWSSHNGQAKGPSSRLSESQEYCTLYRVSCSEDSVQCDRRIYQGEPRPVLIRGEYHLCGGGLISDLDEFLGEYPRTGFVVYRDYICETGAGFSSFGNMTWSTQGTRFLREVISVISEDLYAILQRNSLFAPDLGAYKMDPFDPGLYRNSTSLSASPFEYSHWFLYHHREALDAIAATSADNNPIKALVSYMCAHPDAMYEKCDKLFSRGMVTHDTLPWLFFPNDILVWSKGTSQGGYVLRRPPVEGPTLGLVCWNWGYDGHSLRRRKDIKLSVQIPSHREVRIDQLAVYPLRYATREVADAILNNGKRFWSHRNQGLISYEGPDYNGELIYPYDSRFMVDYGVYSKFHSDAAAFVFSTAEKATFDQWPENIPSSETLTDKQMMLLPQGIHGFYLKEKKWIHLLVDNIQPVNWNKSAFDKLVLSKRTKNLVKGLIMVKKVALQNPDPQTGVKGIKRDDIIAGKGGGLIMLLHGGPGTGKTLTAESVAELAEMPLYSVTCGDIGTSPEAVEKYLNSVLHLGKKWNCVLLLDEADVFLEERSLSDLHRNSLVSVFLRTLEYYDGVLILTSNRVGTFDEAFKSRIQLALHYPPLDAPGRRKIWHNFLNMIQDTTSTTTGGEEDDEKADVEDIKAHMDELAGYELNGRQIRNALTTARQLAVFERETLDWDRVKDSIEVAGEFDKYLRALHGHTDEDWSREMNLR